MSPTGANMTVGNTQQFSFTSLDQFGNPINATVNYSTSNSSIATVNNTSGLVSAISAGNVIITASNGSVTGSASIIVTAVSTPAPSTSSSGGGGGGGSCATSWNCSEWSLCTNSIQTRVCNYPSNWCTPKTVKPTQTQTCVLTTEPSTTIPQTTPQTTVKGSSGITGAITGTSSPVNPTGIVLMSLTALGIIGTFVYRHFRTYFRK